MLIWWKAVKQTEDILRICKFWQQILQILMPVIQGLSATM